jgi:hypothetical protein
VKGGNLNRGAIVEKVNAYESRGIVRPGGAILGAQVGGDANALHCHIGVTVAVIALCVVPWLLHCVWCYSRHLCTVYGVMGAVVAPHVVLRSWSLCYIGVAGAIIAPCVVLWS